MASRSRPRFGGSESGREPDARESRTGGEHVLAVRLRRGSEPGDMLKRTPMPDASLLAPPPAGTSAGSRRGSSRCCGVVGTDAIASKGKGNGTAMDGGSVRTRSLRYHAQMIGTLWLLKPKTLEPARSPDCLLGTPPLPRGQASKSPGCRARPPQERDQGPGTPGGPGATYSKALVLD